MDYLQASDVSQRDKTPINRIFVAIQDFQHCIRQLTQFSVSLCITPLNTTMCENSRSGPQLALEKANLSRSAELKNLVFMGKNSMNLNDKLLKLSIKVKTMLSDERGQDLVEYALVVAIIALGATVAMSTLASDINGVFINIGTKLQTAVGS